MTTDSDAAASKQINAREDAGRARVVDAASAPGLSPSARIAAALMELVAVWREEATWWAGSGKRGGIGAAKDLRQAASRLAGFAIGLDASTPTFTIAATLTESDETSIDTWPLAPATPTLDELRDHGLAVIGSGLNGDSATKFVEPFAPPADTTGDATLDFLLGKTNVYEPKAREPEPVWPEDPERILSDADAITLIDELSREATSVSVPASIDSPFSHPGAPGSGARPPVTPLPYAALPMLASRLPQRDHVSHSYVNSYESCSLSAMLSDASRAGLIGPRRPSWSLVGGNAFHAAVEAYERAMVSIDPGIPRLGGWEHYLNIQIQDTTADMAGSPYANPDTWHVANGGREGYDWWRVEGAAMLDRYVEFHDSTWRATRNVLQMNHGLALEVPYSMSVRTLDGTSSNTAEGKIDAVWLDAGAEALVIVDYKSGRSAPQDTFQLGEYGHALAMLLANEAAILPRTILGRYWLARKGEYTEPVDLLKAHPLEGLQYRYDVAMRGTRAGVFAPHPNPLCVSCGVRDYCPAVSR